MFPGMNRRTAPYRSTAEDWGGGPDKVSGDIQDTKTAEPAALPAARGLELKQNSAFSSWIQYAYFLRFPILGWLTLPMLCVLDGCTGVSALTRGIVTMSGGWQLFHTTFFAIALLMAVLICAKNIVTNGAERFSSEPPQWLKRVLTSDDRRTMWTVLGFAQLPALLTLIYVGWRTISEQTGWAKLKPDQLTTLEAVWPRGGWHWRLFESYGWGFVAAAAFWYLVSVFYYWTYPAPPPDDHTDVSDFKDKHRPAVPLIFPVQLAAPCDQSSATGVEEVGWWRRLIGQGLTERALCSEKPWFAQWLEWTASKLLRVTHIGYAESASKPLYELHFLAIVSLCAIILLYLFLYPLVAPVVVTKGIGADTLLALLIFLAFAGGSITWKHRRMQLVGRTFTLIMLAGLITFYYFFLRDSASGVILMATSFPTMGSILVILIFFQWLFSGATFLMDRYRIPVLSVVLILIFLPKLIPWFDQEHYFDAEPTTKLAATDVDSPEAVIDKRITAVRDGQPLVIVTAMGGGIQAAEWTAQIMAKMESTFRDDPALQAKHYTLHDHLLLASGVSGGSVGLMPYLLEYTAPPNRRFEKAPEGPDKRDLLTARLTSAPGCSGLEAVAWGLEYYDLQRLLLTVRFSWLQITDKGSAPDRTWALTQALNRNLKDKDCGTKAFLPPPEKSAEEMTLAQAAKLLQNGALPAFTFNTTVAETGDRFLLSNYAVAPNSSSVQIPGSILRRGTDFLPAESFLQAYTMDGCCGTSSGGKDKYADISLATAARLSATFPVVSSGTRIPAQFARVASHYLDGGYFDNDGTASAIEFLYAAMRSRKPTAESLKILLVEIRDSDDMNSDINDDDLAHQTGQATDLHGRAAPKPWSTFSQVVAPLVGMWNAGHKSTTRRNRRELCLLEHAYSNGKLEIHHVIFGIPSQIDRPEDKENGISATYKASPLSWKLTEGQKEYIRQRADEEQSTKDSLADAVRWLTDPKFDTSQDVCSVDDQPVDKGSTVDSMIRRVASGGRQ
jgi:hypothetical protein